MRNVGRFVGLPCGMVRTRSAARRYTGGMFSLAPISGSTTSSLSRPMTGLPGRNATAAKAASIAPFGARLDRRGLAIEHVLYVLGFDLSPQAAHCAAWLRQRVSQVKVGGMLVQATRYVSAQFMITQAN